MKYFFKLNFLFIFIFFISSCASSLSPFANFDPTGTQVLLLLAHYDDETIMAPTLMHFKDKGIKVFAIYGTQGEGGSDRRLPPDKKISPEKLAQIRTQEMEQAAKILGMNFYQLNFPDVPIRIPELGYPNPAGRPSRNGKQFYDSGIWNIVEMKLKIKKILEIENIKPTIILTLSNDNGLIHAHHQAMNLIARELIDEGTFQDSLLAAYAVLETQDYALEKFDYKKDILIHLAGNDLLERSYQVYQAHQSQALSQIPKENLKTKREIFTLLNFKSDRFKILEKFLDSSVSVHQFNKSSKWSKWLQSINEK